MKPEHLGLYQRDNGNIALLFCDRKPETSSGDVWTRLWITGEDGTEISSIGQLLSRSNCDSFSAWLNDGSTTYIGNLGNAVLGIDKRGKI